MTSTTSWRLCSLTLVFPTSWKNILFHDDDAAFWKGEWFKVCFTMGWFYAFPYMDWFKCLTLWTQQ